MSNKTDLMNFKDEIFCYLKKYNKSEKDVIFVSDGEKYCNFSEFLNIIKDYKYDNGWGIPYINLDLKIIGNDWWLERHEYDGSEGWTFKTLPTQPKIKSLSIKWNYDHNYNDI